MPYMNTRTHIHIVLYHLTGTLYTHRCAPYTRYRSAPNAVVGGQLLGAYPERRQCARLLRGTF